MNLGLTKGNLPLKDFLIKGYNLPCSSCYIRRLLKFLNMDYSFGIPYSFNHIKLKCAFLSKKMICQEKGLSLCYTEGRSNKKSRIVKHVNSPCD
jgi:hypothetical protein